MKMLSKRAWPRRMVVTAVVIGVTLIVSAACQGQKESKAQQDPAPAARARIFGHVRDFDGKPVEGADIELKAARFESAAETKSAADGSYSMTVEAGVYIALAAVKDYRVKSLEYWAWNVPAFGEVEINPRFDRLEVYGLNAWRPQGGYPSYQIYFRPMSLSMTVAVVTKAGGIDKLGELPFIDIAPELQAKDIAVKIDGESVEVLRVNKVKEAGSPAQSLYGYLIQTPMPQAQSTGDWITFDVTVTDPATGEKGEARLYLARPKYMKAAAPSPGERAPAVEVKPPVQWPTKTWRTSTPEEQGLDSAKLAEAVDFLKAKDPNIHSLLVIRNGVIVVDAAFHPFQSNGLHDIASVTKSVTSTLIGIAVRKGLIKGLDQPMLDFFPDRKIANLDDRKRAITIRDLLTMRSGLACVVQPTEVTLFEMLRSPDWAQFILDQPMTDQPGAKFVYNSGAVHLLSVILRRATGMTALDFARKELFGPLGIIDVIWPLDAQAVSNTGWGDLRLRPRDMAKIGLLYLNKGTWDGQQILSPEWVETVTHKRPEVPENDYGYLWWIYKDAGFYARGRGGQHIVVLPAQNLIVVTTGGGFTSGAPLLESYVIPAIRQGQGSLPPNPSGNALLRSKIEEVGRKPKTTAIVPSEWPATADRISGRTFVLEPNPFGISAMTLSFQDRQAGTLAVVTSPDPDRNPVYAIGFQGEYVIGPGRYGLPAAGKGRWKSPDTLLIELDEIGTISKFVIELTFSADGFMGTMVERTGLGKISLRGKVE